MSRVLFITAALCAFFLIATCTEVTPGMQICKKSADCRPTPQCHPISCINKAYAVKFEPELICTEIFMCEAAYTVDDCACIDNMCVNLNLNRNDC